MAIYEKNVLLMSKDGAGNQNLMYPITRLECVDGAEEALEKKADSDHAHATITHAEIDEILAQ